MPDCRSAAGSDRADEGVRDRGRVAKEGARQAFRRQWVLAGQAIHAIANKERRVSRLPEPFDAPVLEWKGRPERSLYALSPPMSLVGKPPWLLRRQEDGLFRQSLGKRARPGQSYLLVGSAPVDAVASQALEMEECGGGPGASIYAFGLMAPVSAKAQQTLSLLGIGYSIRARVHTQACQLAQHGRDRDRRPARPVPGPQNRRLNLTKPAKPPPVAGRKQEVLQLRE
jgi:hypothetical protein